MKFILGALILLLVLPFVLLLAGMPFRDTFIITIVCGLVLGGVLVWPAASFKAGYDLLWEAMYIYISLSNLNAIITRLQAPTLSIWTELLVLFLLYSIAALLLFFLLSLIKASANRPAVLLPVIAVPLAAAFTSAIDYLPMVIGLLGGVLYGFLYPPISMANEAEDQRKYFWLRLLMAFSLLLWSIGIGFDSLHTILKSITASLVVMYSISLFVYSYRTRIHHQPVGTEVTES